MDDLIRFMQESEAARADFESRLTAMENVVKNMQGAAMESDPSRLPVVIVEKTPRYSEVVPDAGN